MGKKKYIEKERKKKYPRNWQPQQRVMNSAGRGRGGEQGLLLPVPPLGSLPSCRVLPLPTSTFQSTGTAPLGSEGRVLAEDAAGLGLG